MNRCKPEGLSNKSMVGGVPVDSELAPCSATLHSVSQPLTAPTPSNRSLNDSRQKHEGELQDAIAARKVQKADREKLRRDRLNEQFTELGSVLDPDRPKNDKATILTDTIQVLKDLSAEVNRLKAEYATLSEESRELTQEKNELREEKASLKADTENLNAQYQQRLRTMFPWAAMDHSVVLGPTYSYPVPIPVPSGPIPIHPSVQPFSFYGNQNPGPITTYVPYAAPANPPVEQSSAHHASASHVSSRHDAKSRLSSHQRCCNAETCDESEDVATELELKMPGSSAQQDSSSIGRKGKQSSRKNRNTDDGNSSSRYSSSQGLPDSSSNSVGDVPKALKNCWLKTRNCLCVFLSLSSLT